MGADSRAADAVARARDIVVSVLGLAALSPLLAVVAAAVRAVLGAPVLFRQERLGQGGAPFTLIKFRSMSEAQPGREGPEYDAERIGRFGAMLRATSLDELPSLWNLARGQISLVGPRPLPARYWPRYRDVEYERFLVRPGITGLAQVEGRNTLDWDSRLALDVEYVRTRSIAGDLAILARTVPVVLRRTGIGHGDAATMHELPTDRHPTSS